MKNLTRRNFIKSSTLIPLISPMVAVARLSENNNIHFESNEACVR